MEFILGIATAVTYLAYKQSMDTDRKEWNDRQEAAIKAQYERLARQQWIAQKEAMKLRQRRSSFVMPPTINKQNSDI